FRWLSGGGLVGAESLLLSLGLWPHASGLAVALEKLLHAGPGRPAQLFERALGRRLVGAPPNEPRPVPDTVPRHLVEGDLADELRTQPFVGEVLFVGPPAERVLARRGRNGRTLPVGLELGQKVPAGLLGEPGSETHLP